MKYSKEDRLEIGRKIYEGKLTLATAAVNYDINLYTARDYFRMYKASIADTSKRPKAETKGKPSRYDDMSKAELAKELMKLKREVNRALKLAKQQG